MTKFALIGNNISYSLSSILHENMFGIKGVRGATYDIIDAKDMSLDNLVTTLRSEYAGFNVTKPYKVDIIPYLDEIDDEARAIGSVNTVLNASGKLIGYNTDIDGIIATFKLDEISAQNKRCLVIGYGGVARTVVYALDKMGAKSISVTGRNLDKMKTFVNSISDTDITIDQSVTNTYDIVVNATSVGTDNNSETPIDVALIPNIEYYFDLIYSPRETLLASKLRKNGVKCRDGLYMLAVQAAKADEYFVKTTITHREIMKNYFSLAGEIFEKHRKNANIERIVMIGFMGSGKTTIGGKLAQLFNITLRDTDYVVGKRCYSISSIFEEGGEEEFRNLESEVLDEALEEENIVISTGGGIVMRDDNMRLLKNIKHTLIIYLAVDFDVVKERVKGSDRPLFRDVEEARKLLQYRTPRYLSIADIVIDGNDCAERVIDNILTCANHLDSIE